ncbi:hypothetical protein AB0A74_16090 [Saccharothrix sp. NPDC042600]|uniref:hypothetical protein n=1 Tax=Saccharothrix TaxID=2071 RepID=UPI0033C6915A|nr:hypothetical protein GCM10017745_45350 [Saccharothrix mutabilis subsp. capreolus]
MGDQGGRRALRLGAVWLTAVLAFVLVGWLVTLAVGVSSPLAAALALLGPAAMFLVLATLDPGLSPLTRTLPGRVAWSVAMTVGGTVGTLFLVAALGAGSLWPAIPLAGLPAALVAAVLGPWPVTRVVAAGVAVVLVGAGLTVPERTTAERAALRLAAVDAPGGVLAVPPHPPSGPPSIRHSAGGFELDYSGVTLVQRVARGDEPELVHREVQGSNQYERRVGGVVVTTRLGGAGQRDDAAGYRIRLATDQEVVRLLPPVEGEHGSVTLWRFADTVGRLFGESR